ncbi:MAG: hypothetical protein AAF502_22820 [Bacteroidota bacterium]
MKKQAVHRAYNIPDADLYLQCMERLNYAKRDIGAFKTYGYNADKLKAFARLCERFSKLPSDDELVGSQMLTTEKKNVTAEKVKSAIRTIMTRVATKYSNRSGRYRRFGTAKMGDMTDAQLLFCGRRVARVSRQQMDFLVETGLKDDHVIRLLEACKAFENALNIQQDKVADRDISVENRVDLGNKMYEEMVSICNIGKDIWAETNKAKYENYVIYESNNEQKKARKAKEISD